MQVKQIYELVNNSAKQVLGENALMQEDLAGVVDLGNAILDTGKVDNYVRALIDQVGKMIFVNRPYSTNMPSVLMDSWEFGSVLQKVSGDLLDATENESWELTDGTVYEQQQFYKPTATVKFYNSKTTFEIPVSITELQVKESFQSAEQLNSFVSMIYNEVNKSMTVRVDSMVMKTIATAIGETVDKGSSTTKVNLLAKYKATGKGATLTSATCLSDPDFVRYAIYEMGLTADRMTKISRLFNIGAKARFTPKEYLKTVMLSEFERSAGVYLYDANGQFNNEHLTMVAHETVPYWQGSGTDYGFASTSKIDIKLPDGTAVEQGGILAVMFDRDAVAVCNQNRRVTTAYNAKAEFFNNWYKFDCSYFVDTNENIVVFYVED